MDNSFNENLIRAKMRKSQKGLLSGGKEPKQMVEGSGEPNYHGMPKLPVGQKAVSNWPVLDLGVIPNLPLDQWTLSVHGECENPFVVNWKEFLALPQVDDFSDFHCVTSWSRMDNHWRGVSLKAIAQLAKVKSTAKYVYFTGYDGYSTNLTLDETLDPDVLLVHTWEGRPLAREHGGPVRMIVPRKYAWKGSKWIKEIIFLSEDKKGFWELRGYSNTAEPWYDDRYAEPEI